MVRDAMIDALIFLGVVLAIASGATVLVVGTLVGLAYVGPGLRTKFFRYDANPQESVHARCE